MKELKQVDEKFLKEKFNIEPCDLFESYWRDESGEDDMNLILAGYRVIMQTNSTTYYGKLKDK